MSEPYESQADGPARKPGGIQGSAPGSRPIPPPGSVPGGGTDPDPATLEEPAGGGIGAAIPFDPLRLLLAVRRHWMWIVAGAVLAAVPAGFGGWWRLQTTYTATVQLIRRDLPNSFRAAELGEAFKPREFSPATVVAMMRSPTLLARVGARAQPAMTANGMLSSLVIIPERNTDLISVSFRSTLSADFTAGHLNLYAQEVVDLTRTLQQQEAVELDRFLNDQLSRAEGELTEVNRELLLFARDASYYNAEREIDAYLRDLGNAEAAIQEAHLQTDTLGFRIRSLERELVRQNPVSLRLTEARDQLKSLLLQYTDANPLVAEQRTRIESLEADAAASTHSIDDFQPGANTVANSMFLDLVNLRAQREALQGQFKVLEERRSRIEGRLKDIPEKSMNFARLKGRQASLEGMRTLLAGRQREARLFAEDAPGYYRLFAPASPLEVAVSGKTRKLLIVTLAAIIGGAGLALLLVLAREALDDRILSPADLRRATRAPLIARLEDIADRTPAELAIWRYRTWAALARELSDPESRSLACGIISAQAGEGRSTWIQLLALAARERGLHSVAVVAGAGPEPAPGEIRADLVELLDHPERLGRLLPGPAPTAVVVRIPRDWSWDVEARARWALALAEWRRLPNVALLLELPPATDLDAILLAETVPAVLWLASSGRSRQGEIVELVATTREGPTRIAGTVLNRMPDVFARLPDLSRFGFALVGALLLGFAPRNEAQETPDAAPGPLGASNPVLALTGSGPGTGTGTATAPRLAAWQERLELGPGDIVSLSIFGRRDSTRSDVPIGPDGRLSYLQAQGIGASGLTIDELRGRLTAEIRRYQRNAEVLVTPVAWRSKKYYILGTVLDRGAFHLDRPTTIIEATARARGIATGLLEQNTVEIADLSRAFLIRNGRRMPVDFARLFQQGDLSQNILIEPEDYLYYPSSTLNEVYVLGSVVSPGTVGVGQTTTVLGVITTRGGFAAKAHRQRVLIVRGALSEPETHVVDLRALLAGKGVDFPLKPRDIVYVADRPWARVEELLDLAISAFTQTAVATWTGLNVGPVLGSPILPETR